MDTQKPNNSYATNNTQAQEEKRETACLHHTATPIPAADIPECKLSRQDQHDFIVKQGLSETEYAACEQFQANVDALFIRIKKKYNLSNEEMATILYPYVRSAEEVSKICSTNKNRKDKRHYKLEGLPALFYVFAESIDELLLFECEQRHGFTKNPTAVPGSASKPLV